MKWIGKRKFNHEIFGKSEEIVIIEKVNENHPVISPTFDIIEHFQQTMQSEFIEGNNTSWGMNGIFSSTLSGIKRLVNQDTGYKNKDWEWTIIE
jgi:uncharacterized protein YdhG (YjbR/CyaY superfamily)